MAGVLALIPARGGSKRVPRKNLRLLCGKPLLVHTVEAALSCPLVSDAVVSTEDPDIASVALAAGAKVIERPPDLARDETKTEPVITHAITAVQAGGGAPDDLCLLQATSPLRTADHISDAIQKYQEFGRLPTISVTRTSAHLNKVLREENGYLRPLFGEEVFRRGGGSLGGTFLPNGAIYLTRVDWFMTTEDLYSHSIVPYVMSEGDSIDIDTEADLLLAEWLMQRRKTKAKGL